MQRTHKGNEMTHSHHTVTFQDTQGETFKVSIMGAYCWQDALHTAGSIMSPGYTALSSDPFPSFIMPTVSVGDGLTTSCGSDSSPATVRRVSASGKTIWFSGDDYKITGGPYEYGSYIPNEKIVYTTRWETPRLHWTQARWSAKQGWFLVNGRPVSVKGRRFYRDPQF